MSLILVMESLCFSLFLPLSPFLKVYFVDYSYSCPTFSTFVLLHQYPPSLQQSPLSSCPRVIHISSLASPFPIPFLTSLCLFCTYQSCFLIHVPFPPFYPFPLPADNSPNDLHTCSCSGYLLSLFVCFLDLVVDSCEFVTFLMVTVDQST